MRRVQNGVFLGFLGALGFLGCMAAPELDLNPNLKHLTWLSLLSFGALLVFVPFPESRVKMPIDPKRKFALLSLGFLGFLAHLAGPHQKQAIPALFAVFANGAVRMPRSIAPQRRPKFKVPKRSI